MVNVAFYINSLITEEKITSFITGDHVLVVCGLLEHLMCLRIQVPMTNGKSRQVRLTVHKMDSLSA